MTMREEIADWLDEGVQQGASHMIVVCDTFSHEDFPVFVTNGVSRRVREYQASEFTQVMEVYDLSMSKIEQLNEKRAWHL